MKLVLIETFLAVASLSHFRKAAERLNTTQPNVSARMSELERTVGGPLFVRQKGGVALTPVGRHLLPYAERVLETTNAFAAQAGVNVLQEGTLRLALSESMVSIILPEFIQEFSRTYPNVTVDILVDNTTNQRRMLIDRAVDLCLLMGPVSKFDIVNLPLMDIPLTWTVSPDHPLNRGVEVSATELSKWPIITYSHNSRPLVELRDAFRLANAPRTRFFCSNSLNASLTMIKEGLGIGTLPMVFAEAHFMTGDIVALASTFQPGKISFTASYPNDPLNHLAKVAADIAVGVANKKSCEAS